MAALTGPRKTEEIQEARRRALPVKAETACHQGGIAVLQGGVAVPGKVADDLTAVGIFEHSVTGGAADGDKSVTTRRGVFKFDNDGTDPITMSHLKQDCYIVDDQTVSSSHDTNARSVAGSVYDVDANGVWVEFK